MMNYEQTMNYLYKTVPMFQKVGSIAYKKGIRNSFLIDKYFHHPHEKYMNIHVAGTNGKGSTVHFLASILQEAGYRVGLYSSPHLLDFTERIKINGIPILKDFVVKFIYKHKNFFESIHPSFFELTTGMAFYYFFEQEVDIAVIEVGLGGRLDCTNIITPILSIITNVSLDHTNLLGSTLKQIAAEKAGIIKPDIPVIIGEAKKEIKEVFLTVKKELKHKKLFFVQEQKIIFSSSFSTEGYWKICARSYPNLICGLGGYAQIKNVATVLYAISILKQSSIINFPKEAVYKGFRYIIKNTKLQGRWQIVQHDPKVILDIVHNAGGLQYVVQQLRLETFSRLHIVFGIVKDKDIDPILRILPKNAFYYFTQVNIPRVLHATILQAQAINYGLKGEKYATVFEAFTAAKKEARKNDLIFVGGSTFIVAEMLMVFQNVFLMY